MNDIFKEQKEKDSNIKYLLFFFKIQKNIWDAQRQGSAIPVSPVPGSEWALRACVFDEATKLKSQHVYSWLQEDYALGILKKSVYDMFVISQNLAHELVPASAGKKWAYAGRTAKSPSYGERRGCDAKGVIMVSFLPSFLPASYTVCASVEVKLTKTLFYRHFELK